MKRLPLSKPPLCLLNLRAGWYTCTDLSERFDRTHNYFYGVFYRLELEQEFKTSRRKDGKKMHQCHFYWPGYQKALEIYFDQRIKRYGPGKTKGV